MRRFPAGISDTVARRIGIMAEPVLRPTRRTSALVVKEAGAELLVYDLERHRAHRLNSVAASVWRACDGTRELSALGSTVRDETGGPVPGEVVRYAVQSLGRAGLMTTAVSDGALTRRDVMRRLGTAAVALLPFVATVVVPVPAQAQSCLPNNAPVQCTGNCCSACCCTSLGGICVDAVDCPDPGVCL
jgi:Coenzyme PQQ synthesis protein D (PqqD)